MFLIWRFLANAHQRQIKDRIKICLHEDGVVLTAPDAKINTGKIFFKKNANLSTRQINQLYSIYSIFAGPTIIRGRPREVESSVTIKTISIISFHVQFTLNSIPTRPETIHYLVTTWKPDNHGYPVRKVSCMTFSF